MTAPVTDKTLRRVLLINRYATPLAIFLVASGIFFAQPTGAVRGISLGLLVFSLAFNLGVAAWIRAQATPPPWLVKSRMAVNILVNALLLYYLGAYWWPTWMLLSLTPIAAGFYGSRARTWQAIGGSAAVLALVQALRHFQAPLEWGQTLAEIVFIAIISLMINEMKGEEV